MKIVTTHEKFNFLPEYEFVSQINIIVYFTKKKKFRCLFIAKVNLCCANL